MKGSNEEARGRTRYGARFWIATSAAVTLTMLGMILPAAALAVGGPPSISESAVTSVGVTQASVQASLDPNLKVTTYSFQYITQGDYEKDGKAFGEGTRETPQSGISEGLGEPHLASATIEGLAPGALYRTRLFAENPKGKEGGEVLFFGTYPEAPAGLPDSRAYEQASPVDKDGGDAIGLVPFVKAALDGESITFGSTSGIPGGVGAQELPTYLATREDEGQTAHWETQGLLPPARFGPGARVVGWTPDFTRVFQQATRFGETATRALYERPASGGEPNPITPSYLQSAPYAYAGSSADESTTIFESTSGQVATTPPGREGRSNVYAWDGSHVRLASVLPGGSPAPQGAFAGPYEWALGRTGEGGAARQYYTQEERAVSKDGSAFFTTAGAGHIYQRRNPIAKEEDCANLTKACTIDVSPSRRTPSDPGGKRPRAFAGASADGSTAFFTSPEELTDDAHTGPEVEEPKIGRATIGPGEEKAEEVLPELLTDHHAVGIVTQGEFIYWADPSQGTIGRAKLNGAEADDEYVQPGETEAETHPETEPGVMHSAPSTPRYVATQGEYIYWTNTGPLGDDLNGKQREVPVIGAGTIGRARLGSEKGEEVKPEFIAAATNPQGVVVNESHIYWANSLNIEGETEVGIGRAAIDGSSVEQHFYAPGNIFLPYGMALSATRVYWTVETLTGFGLIGSIPLEGGSQSSLAVSESVPGDKLRGIALIGPNLYWAAQGKEEIGRVRLSDLTAAPECQEIPSCEAQFLHVQGAFSGLAIDPPERHLYWSVNGEIAPHPGNDLYRFQAEGTGGCVEAGGCLTDLTADSTANNGAEVKGVVGVSEDGTRAYFAANAALPGTGASKAGGCGNFALFANGQCNLYAWEAGGGPAGRITFLASLNAGGAWNVSDEVDWLPTMADSVLDVQKGSQLSPDGRTLLFRSREKLSEYENEGFPELYRYQVGQGISCVSCNPTGLPPKGKPSLGSIQPSALRAAFTSATTSRNLSENGERVFFETPDPLSVSDTNGAENCKAVGSSLQDFPACLDVYEWEAPEEGSCKAGASAYSPLDKGCLYLISTGKGDWASLVGDASATGEDVFFFTREGIAGQDKDELLDVYDARVGGGIAAQNPPPSPPPCESPEACRSYVYPSEAEESPGSASFTGPLNPKPKHSKAGVKKHHQKKHRRQRKKKGRQAHAKQGAGR